MDFGTTEYLELNTFTVRISSCDVTNSPDSLDLTFITQQTNEYLEINGNQRPHLEPACLTLQKDRVDFEKSEVVYVNTDKVKVNHLGGHCVVTDRGLVLAVVEVGKWEYEEVKRDLGMERDEKTGYVIEMFPVGACPEFIRSKVESQASMEVELSGFVSDIPVKLKMSIRLDTDEFNVRLFYVRISDCDIDKAPSSLKLCYKTPGTWGCFVVNGYDYSEHGSHSIILYRSHVNTECLQVIYTSIANVVTSCLGVNFDIIDNDHHQTIATGSVERWRCDWTKTCVGSETDVKSGYALQIVPAPKALEFIEAGPPGSGRVKPCVEVFVAGCCSTLPVALSSTIKLDS